MGQEKRREMTFIIGTAIVLFLLGLMIVQSVTNTVLDIYQILILPPLPVPEEEEVIEMDAYYA